MFSFPWIFFLLIFLAGVFLLLHFLWQKLKAANFKISDLWHWNGAIERGPYLILGLILFAIKHNSDRYIYYFAYRSGGLNWVFFDYLYPFTHIGQRELTQMDAQFFLLFFLIEIPFVYIGVGLILKRLRALRWPLWLLVFFFIPLLNFLFFILLSMDPQPTRPQTLVNKNMFKNILDVLIPHSAWGNAIAAIGITAVLAFFGVLIVTAIYKQYGLSLFVAGPIALGLIAALLNGYHEPKSLKSCIGVANLSIFILAGFLVLFALEGIICIAMALPIGMPLAAGGAWIGYLLQRRLISKNDTARIITFLMIIIPLMMGAEYAIQPPPTVCMVKTHVDIDASKETIWENMVAFPALPDPDNILFKAGVAYPTHVEIDGEGIGAIRKCHFTTGTVIEPITVWDENRLLRFDIVEQPPPMKELSPYDIHPPHLEGNYLISQSGQFLLTKLPNGKIRLEGTSWYSNKMWPENYWRLWSDYIVHQIHLRVLKHIKNISEAS